MQPEKKPEKVPEQDNKPGAVPVNKKSDSNEPLQKRMEGLQSNELVIAFSGPVGCRMDDVVNTLKELLETSKYNVHSIKISDRIKEAFEVLKKQDPSYVKTEGLDAVDLETSDAYLRVSQLMKVGDALRKYYENDILAQLSINRINKIRLDTAEPEFNKQKEDLAKLENGETVDLARFTTEFYVPEKTVYLIDHERY